MLTNEQMQAYADKVAVLNDKHRKAMKHCVMTQGVARLSVLVKDIIAQVRDFNDFNLQNDPYGEHDFGSFEIAGIKIFWKIDYYDRKLQGYCDALDPKCRRVLTIMLAEEY
jgi:hypothetical protein